MIGAKLVGGHKRWGKYIGPDPVGWLDVRWSEIETSPGVYSWPLELDEDIAALYPSDYVLTVKGAPVWARVDKAYECSMPANLDRYADFVREVVIRYRPWAVSIWNEPEVPAKASPAPEYLGGFGLEYAKRYGKMVKKTYKKVHDMTKVIAGELLLGDGGAFWREARKKCAGYYDAVAFHAYAMERDDFDIILRKALTLRGVGEKAPLMCSETHYLAWQNTRVSDDFEQAQADYLQWVVDNFESLGVEHVAVYALPRSGWRNADFVDSGKTRPIYDVYLEAQ